MKVYQNHACSGEAKNAYLDCSFDGSEAYDEDYFKFYTHVADVDTDNMRVVFEVMNLWNNDEIITKHTQCRSLSAGDIIEDNDGILFMVDRFGFMKIG